ncbi:MAG: hypothetical protein KKF58_01750 [Gammaproteobacteria bacterium]|nr:hypothetical protein [Gammaproteobacteria bacterium]
MPTNLYSLPEVRIRNNDDPKKTIIPDFVIFEKGLSVSGGYRASVEFKFNYIRQAREYSRLYDALQQQRFPDQDKFAYGNNDNLFVVYLLADLFNNSDFSMCSVVEKQYRSYITKKFTSPEDSMVAAVKT